MGTATLRGWGRAVSSTADVVVPAAGDALLDHGAALVDEGAAGGPPDAGAATGPGSTAAAPRGIIARGAARSYGDAAQNAGGTVIDMTARAGIHRLDLQTGRARVDAGLTLDELLRAIVPHGWFLPVTPGTRMVTVGGAIAADVHGKNHPAHGSIRAHLTGFTLLLADGERRWVTPSDDEVFAATLGGMGLTGVVLNAELELRPIATAHMRSTRITTTDLAHTLEVMAATTQPYCVASLDLTSRSARLGRAIVDSGEHAEVSDLPPAARREPLRYAPTPPPEVPDVFPSGLLNRVTAQAATAALFARAPRTPRHGVVDLAAYFYPLDAVGQWNRVYGPRGFVQYQVAVPHGEERALHHIARTLAGARCPTFISVLKRLGPGGGMLSFPIEGWTLAVDIPAGVAGLSTLLNRCDDMVCEARGRVYLAKDGRVRADRMGTMYPDLDAWLRVRDRLDPHGRWQSDLGRRLGLCSS